MELVRTSFNNLSAAEAVILSNLMQGTKHNSRFVIIIDDPGNKNSTYSICKNTWGNWARCLWNQTRRLNNQEIDNIKCRLIKEDHQNIHPTNPKWTKFTKYPSTVNKCKALYNVHTESHLYNSRTGDERRNPYAYTADIACGLYDNLKKHAEVIMIQKTIPNLSTPFYVVLPDTFRNRVWIFFSKDRLLEECEIEDLSTRSKTSERYTNWANNLR